MPPIFTPLPGASLGRDILNGGPGRDLIQGLAGGDRLTGGTQTDIVEGGAGNDFVYGGPGADWLYGHTSTNPQGGPGDEDYLFGGTGDDHLFGGAGRDRLDGQQGNDRLDGGAGGDRLYGGDGTDVISGAAGGDFVNAGTGDDTVTGGTGRDILDGNAGADRILGGGGRDRIFGGDGDDQLFGGAGRDVLVGGQGNDALSGGTGHDTLLGGAGNDRLDGGAGADLLQAQGGDDLLIFDATAIRGYTPDRYDGGAGFDTLRIDLTAGQFNASSLRSELIVLNQDLETGVSLDTYRSIPGLNLRIKAIEALDVFVDGVQVDLSPPAFQLTEDAAPLLLTPQDVAPTLDTTGLSFAPLSQLGALGAVASLTPDGLLQLDPSVDRVQTLTQDQFAYRTYSVALTDDGGQQTRVSFDVSITGTNDIPTPNPTPVMQFERAGTFWNFSLRDGVLDADGLDTLSLARIDTLPTWITRTDFNLYADLSDPALPDLAVGEEFEFTFDYTLIDNAGIEVDQTVALTVYQPDPDAGTPICICITDTQPDWFQILWAVGDAPLV